MPRKSKAQTLIDIHAEALRDFDEIQTAMRDERLQCLQDRRFYSIAGAQWEGPLGVQFENKPRLEINKIHMAIIRIINEYRKNRVTVKFVDKAGTDHEGIVDICADLYRADEKDSLAEEAYDNAFEEAVGGGFGAFRLTTCYEDDEDEDDDRQRCRIEPIYDADSSVFFNLNAKRQDKKDATRCYVLTAYTRDAYEDEFDEAPTSMPKQVYQVQFDWLTPDVIYVAEYYRIEFVKETIHFYRNQLGDEKKVSDTDLDKDEGLADQLQATGYTEVRQKQIKRRKVHKYLMDGCKILEDCGIIAGKYIPIIPVYGKRWFVDNIERCMGHVRLAKDSQRLKNMQTSKLAEYAATSASDKPIFTPEQMAGHAQMWADDNVKNYPYLLINQLTDPNGNPTLIGPQSYTKSTMIPQPMAALLQMSEQDMQDVLGNQQSADQLQPNVSGFATELVQNRLDMQSFIYVSNFAKAIQWAGEVWLWISKDILVEENRKMKGVDVQGEPKILELNKPMADEAGNVYTGNDLSTADLDVDVDVGPSSSTKRQSTVRTLTTMMGLTQDPETQQVLSAMAMMNMEGEGINEVNDYFRRKLIKMGVVKPNDEELKSVMEEAQNTPPDPNAVFLQASAQQAQADAKRAEADVLLKVAQTKKTEAQTVETLAGVDLKERGQIVNTMKTLNEMQTSDVTSSSQQGA